MGCRKEKPCARCNLQWETQQRCTWLYLGSSRLARLISKCSFKIDLVLGVTYFQCSVPFMTRWEGQLHLLFQGCFFILEGLRMGWRNFRESLDPQMNMAWSWKSLRLRIFRRTPLLLEKRLALYNVNKIVFWLIQKLKHLNCNSETCYGKAKCDACWDI